MKSPELNKSDGSENYQDGYDDDEFDESESFELLIHLAMILCFHVEIVKKYELKQKYYLFIGKNYWWKKLFRRVIEGLYFGVGEGSVVDADFIDSSIKRIGRSIMQASNL